MTNETRLRPPARLSILFARNANQAVIFRTGPTQVTRMITWDTAKDRFTDGQWVRHKIYPERSAVSPNGRHVIYFAYKHLDRQGAPLGGFTALSRPPYFKAQTFIPEGGTWGGGGVFVDDRHVWIRSLSRKSPHPLSLPKGVSAVYLPDGLPRKSDPRPDHFVYASGAKARVSQTDLRTLYSGAGGIFAESRRAPPLPDWCVVREGCLYRRKQSGSETLVRDFNSMEYEAIPAPY